MSIIRVDLREVTSSDVILITVDVILVIGILVKFGQHQVIRTTPTGNGEEERRRAKAAHRFCDW